METAEVRPGKLSPSFASYWLPVLATGSAFFMIVLDTSIVNLALAKIGTEYGSNLTSLQWLVDGYAMIFASLLLGAGALGDRLGVKGTFMVGLLIFTAASAGCGAAPTMAALQIARVAQGLGAALLLPNSLAALNHTFSNSSARTKAVSAWASAGALGVAVGPVLGGLLVQTLGWRSIFMVNIPVGLLALWMTHHYVTKGERHAARSLDPYGQVLAVGMLASATYALITIGHVQSQLSAWLPRISFIILTAAFIVVENGQDSPMLPLRLLRVRTLGPVALAGLLHNVAIYGLIFVLSLTFQRLLGLSPIKAGMLFLPMTLSLAVGTRIGAKILRIHGPFGPLVGGHLVAGLGALLLASLELKFGPFVLIAPLTVVGFAAGLTTPAMSLAVLDSVSRNQGGLASGILNSARQVGGVIGVAVLGASLGEPASISGAQTAEFVAAVSLMLASIVAFIALRSRAHQD